MKESKISFVTDVSTREAAVYTGLFAWTFMRNVAKGVDRAAHRLPWVFMGVTVAASILVSYACIGQARAERDNYNKRAVWLDQQLENYRALYGDGKGTSR